MGKKILDQEGFAFTAYYSKNIFWNLENTILMLIVYCVTMQVLFREEFWQWVDPMIHVIEI